MVMELAVLFFSDQVFCSQKLIYISGFESELYL
jgi:hypothetical protein